MWQVGPVNADNIEDSLRLLRKEKEKLAFLSWEEEILRRSLEGYNPTGIQSLVATRDTDKVAGVILFGVGEEYSSINHLVVDMGFRGQGLSNHLLTKALEKVSGRRCHLMVVNGNTEVNRLFQSAGFNSVGSFLEIDLDEKDPSEPMGDVCPLGLRSLLDIVPSSDSAWNSLSSQLLYGGIRRAHYVSEENISAQDKARLVQLGFRVPKGESLWIKNP